MSRVDRSRLPVPGPDRPFHFPRMAKRRLGNGLEVRAISHHAVPIVSMCLLVPGGAAVDPPDRPGLVSLTAGLLDEGSRGQSALENPHRTIRVQAAIVTKEPMGSGGGEVLWMTSGRCLRWLPGSQRAHPRHFKVPPDRRM